LHREKETLISKRYLGATEENGASQIGQTEPMVNRTAFNKPTRVRIPAPPTLTI